jgi:hypothetical protein
MQIFRETNYELRQKLKFWGTCNKLLLNLNYMNHIQDIDVIYNKTVNWLKKVLSYTWSRYFILP